MFEFWEAAQMDPEQEQLDNRYRRKPLRIFHRKYLRNRLRIAMLERQFRDFNNLDLFLPLDIFRPHTGP